MNHPKKKWRKGLTIKWIEYRIEDNTGTAANRMLKLRSYSQMKASFKIKLLKNIYWMVNCSTRHQDPVQYIIQ